ASSSRSTQASSTAELDVTISRPSGIDKPGKPQARVGSEHSLIVLRFEPKMAQIGGEAARALRFNSSRTGPGHAISRVVSGEREEHHVWTDCGVLPPAARCAARALPRARRYLLCGNERPGAEEQRRHDTVHRPLATQGRLQGTP